MIVKTGANYQAEGGYIEASREGDAATIVIDDKTIEIDDINGLIDVGIPGNIRKTDDLTASVSCWAVNGSGRPDCISFSVTTTDRQILYFNKIVIILTVVGNAKMKLAEGSRDCILTDKDTYYTLVRSGSDPVVILEAA